MKLSVDWTPARRILISVGRPKRLAVAKGKSMHEMMAIKAEVAREIAVRRSVYPKLISQGKLTQEEADRRMHLMRGALMALDRVAIDNGLSQALTDR